MAAFAVHHGILTPETTLSQHPPPILATYPGFVAYAVVAIVG